jgi:hypothetical protein
MPRATPKFANSNLGVTVMVMPMMMVVAAGCEGRAGDYQQQEGGENELLHAMQISTVLALKNGANVARIKSAITPGKRLLTRHKKALKREKISSLFLRLSAEFLRGVHW